jgi:hypothetical protein
MGMIIMNDREAQRVREGTEVLLNLINTILFIVFLICIAWVIISFFIFHSIAYIGIIIAVVLFLIVVIMSIIS